MRHKWNSIPTEFYTKKTDFENGYVQGSKTIENEIWLNLKTTSQNDRKLQRIGEIVYKKIEI
jgi:hypothetical protein